MLKLRNTAKFQKWVRLPYALPILFIGKLPLSERFACKFGHWLIDAARFYARHHGRHVKRKAVHDAVEEMIEAKKTGGLSDVYLNDLRYRLGMFADCFRCDVVSLTPDDMQNFFDSIDLSARSFNNFLCALKTFCRFAQDRG